MKINSFNKILILSFLVLHLHSVCALPVVDEIPQALVEALKTGNSVLLSKFFNSSIELAIPGKEDIYSSQQAELIVKDFFTKHVPSDFLILHKGGKEGSQYAIGNLITSKGNFRVTLLIKVRDDKSYIHQLRFEEENAD